MAVRTSLCIRVCIYLYISCVVVHLHTFEFLPKGYTTDGCLYRSQVDQDIFSREIPIEYCNVVYYRHEVP